MRAAFFLGDVGVTGAAGTVAGRNLAGRGNAEDERSGSHSTNKKTRAGNCGVDADHFFRRRKNGAVAGQRRGGFFTEVLFN